MPTPAEGWSRMMREVRKRIRARPHAFLPAARWIDAEYSADRLRHFAALDAENTRWINKRDAPAPHPVRPSASYGGCIDAKLSQPYANHERFVRLTALHMDLCAEPPELGACEGDDGILMGYVLLLTAAILTDQKASNDYPQLCDLAAYPWEGQFGRNWHGKSTEQVREPINDGGEPWFSLVKAALELTELDPPSETAALRLLLTERDSWFVDQLPPEVDADTLRLLDEKGWLQARAWLWQGENAMPAGAMIEWRINWVSPVRTPRDAGWGTWEELLATCGGHKPNHHPAEIQVTEVGKAALARADRPADDAKPTPPMDPTPPPAPPPPMKRPVRLADVGKQVNQRADQVKAKLDRRGYHVDGPKRAYCAEFEHVLMAYPKLKRRLREWADKAYPLADGS